MSALSLVKQMLDVDVGMAFSAEIGIALGLRIANCVLPIMNPPEKIVQRVILC